MIRTKLPMTGIPLGCDDSRPGERVESNVEEGKIFCNDYYHYRQTDQRPTVPGKPVVLVALSAWQVEQLMAVSWSNPLLVDMAQRFKYMVNEGIMDSEQTYKGTGTVTVEFDVELEVGATSRVGAEAAMKQQLESDWTERMDEGNVSLSDIWVDAKLTTD